VEDIFVAPKHKEEKRKEIKPGMESKEKKEEKQSSIRDELFHYHKTEVGLFSSFHLYPTNVTFKEQEEDEEIVLFLRKHFITNFYWIFITALVVILPTVFFIFRDFFPIPPIPTKFNIIAFLFYFTIVGAYVYLNFISWFFNVSLVSHKRLIDLDFVNVLSQDMAVTKLNLIEDVSFNQNGFIRSYFNYGDIFVQTAGEKMHFDFLAVPEPEHVLNIIENLMGGQRHVR
jgi:hypothetical protein